MQLVELFVPLETGSGERVGRDFVERVVRELTDRFGGATAFTRAPAEGLWKQGSTIQEDRVIIVEVLVDELDEAWWKGYRGRLEAELEQDEVMIRATPCRRI